MTCEARTIVEDCANAGTYVVTQWNKPDDLHPWDINPHYVAHMSFDGVPSASNLPAKEVVARPSLTPSPSPTGRGLPLAPA